jgi:hypothetical protein
VLYFESSFRSQFIRICIATCELVIVVLFSPRDLFLFFLFLLSFSLLKLWGKRRVREIKKDPKDILKLWWQHHWYHNKNLDETNSTMPKKITNDCGLHDHEVRIRPKLRNEVVSFYYFCFLSVPLSFLVFASFIFVSAACKQTENVIFHLVTVSNHISLS